VTNHNNEQWNGRGQSAPRLGSPSFFSQSFGNKNLEGANGLPTWVQINLGRFQNRPVVVAGIITQGRSTSNYYVKVVEKVEVTTDKCRESLLTSCTNTQSA
jgi:hypothetical protein